jgi:DNA-binding LacI/PurR family transcriptional regulator
MPNTTIGVGIQEALEQLSVDLGASANILLRFADANPEATIAAVLKLRPLAVVDFGSLRGPDRDRLAAQGVPCVPDARKPQRQGGLGLEDAIAAMQIKELTKNGQRRVVFAGFIDNRSDPYGPARMSAITRACHRLGLPEPFRVDVAASLDAATEAVHNLGGLPVGVAAYNDTVALALLAAAAKLGIEVPGELSIVGMDRTDVGQLWTPRLSTVAVNMRAIVDQVASQLLQQLPNVFKGPPRNPRRSIKHDVLTLIVGETT